MQVPGIYSTVYNVIIEDDTITQPDIQTRWRRWLFEGANTQLLFVKMSAQRKNRLITAKNLNKVPWTVLAKFTLLTVTGIKNDVLMTLRNM